MNLASFVPPLWGVVGAQAISLVAIWYGIPFWLLCGVFAVYGALEYYRKETFDWVVPAVLSLVCAFSLQTLLEQHKALRHYAKQEVQAKAVVEEIVPIATKSGHRYKLLLTILSIEPNLITTPFKAVIYMRRFPRCRVADTIAISKLTLTKDAKRFGLKDNRILTAFVSSLPIKVIDRPWISWAQKVSLLRYQVLKALQKALPEPTAHLIGVLFAGASTSSYQLSQHTKDIFGRWGIMHYLARSGLHVAVLFLLWYWLLTVISIPFWWRQVLMLIALLIFAVCTYPSISFWRAFIFIIIRQVTLIAGYQLKSLTALALTIMTLLFWFPASLFAADFQLTVGLTLIILLSGPIFVSK